LTFDFESSPVGDDDSARPDSPQPSLSRRELRLQAEKEKVEQIAREREVERIRAAAIKRANEIRLQKEEELARQAETERFQEQINKSQPLPTLSTQVDSFPPVITTPVSENEHAAAPSSADRGKKGAQRRERAQRKALAKAATHTARPPRGQKPGNRGQRIRNGFGRAFVVLVVGGLLAVLALPATGFNATNTGWAAEKKNADQSAEVTSVGAEAEQIALPEYSVTTYSDLLRLTYGLTSGYQYAVNSSGNIRWPFPVVVPISSGFGGRVAPCLGCSSYHDGLDFDPADGTPFYAIAAGKVVEIHDDTWGLGKWVVIRHDINGLKFDSVYAHMIRDSTGVHMGQEVQVGDYVGRVGNSGFTTGAHLHLGIIIDGLPVDPFDFLKKHTRGN